MDIVVYFLLLSASLITLLLGFIKEEIGLFPMISGFLSMTGAVISGLDGGVSMTNSVCVATNTTFATCRNVTLLIQTPIPALVMGVMAIIAFILSVERLQ